MLGVSARQLERRAARGEIETRLESRERGRGKLALYARADIEAILAGKPNSHAVPVPDGNGSAEPNGRNPSAQAPTAVTVRKTGGEEIAFGILQQIAAGFAPQPQYRPWLTLAEAAEYSGLPAAWLRRQARSGAAFAVNVGTDRSPRWRFSREMLQLAAAVRPILPTA